MGIELQKKTMINYQQEEEKRLREVSMKVKTHLRRKNLRKSGKKSTLWTEYLKKKKAPLRAEEEHQEANHREEEKEVVAEVDKTMRVKKMKMILKMASKVETLRGKDKVKKRKPR